MITNNNIDNGKPFDRGRAFSDYAKYRDIYPWNFTEKFILRALAHHFPNMKLPLSRGSIWLCLRKSLPRDLMCFITAH